jgi:N-methylhydantoinase A
VIWRPSFVVSTAKAALIEGGQVPLTSDYEVGGGINLSRSLIQGGGYSLRLPVVDVSEVGAGGGSIARTDELRRLSVGPESAGAYPGPACYGRGGLLATVTDANVVLGYINPSRIGVGTISINRESAYTSIAKYVAEPMGISVEDAAFSIHSIATAAMTRAVRAVTTYRGRDPRNLSLVAFGGSGPIHAVGVAQALRIDRVVVPPLAGVLSALGLLLATVEHHFVRSVMTRLDEGNSSVLTEHFSSLYRQAQEELSTFRYADEDLDVTRSLDVRYRDQGHSLNLPVMDWPITPEATQMIVDGFHRLHEGTYGHNAPEEVVEAENARIVISRRRRRSLPTSVPSRERPRTAEVTRHAYFDRDQASLEVPTMARERITDPMSGPVLIDELDSTIVVPPDWQVSRDPFDNLVIRRAGPV